MRMPPSNGLQKACEQRFLTQPAFSRRINVIETYLRTPILDRSTKPATVLPGIAAYRDRMQELSLALKNLTNELRHNHPEASQPVVLVVATSRAVAEDAMALIDIAWEECPPVVDAAAALQADSPLIHPDLGSNLALAHRIGGDSFAAVAALAHCVVQRELVFARHTGVPLEGRAIVAEFDPASRNLTVHQSTQVPQQMRALLAQLFGLRETDVRVLTPDVGGAFGIKLHVYDDEMATVAASVLLGQPVKFISDRFEAFNSDVHARSHRVSAQLALDAQGTVLGFAVDDLMDIGAYSMYPRTSVLEGLQVVSLVGAPYCGTVLQAQLRVAYQNKAPVGAKAWLSMPANRARNTKHTTPQKAMAK